MYSLEKKRRRKKIIEITLIVLSLSWMIIFLIDYFRYEDSNPPIITIKKETIKYSDGIVKEYVALGYIYREYERRSIGDTELVPFWQNRQEPQPIDDFPVTYKDYNVPVNNYHLVKYKSLLYFYNNMDLVGTYKCLNTDKDCTIATSGVDQYNIAALDVINNPDKQPEFYVIDKKYAVIDDSYYQPKATPKQYKRTIYIFDIAKNKIIGEYADVKYSKIDSESGYADGAENNLIVMNSNKKWGVININKGKVKEVLPLVYDSINYNVNTGHYIIYDNGWYILNNLKEKKLSVKFANPIVNLTYVNNNLVVETARVDGNNISYQVLGSDGVTEILSDPDNNIIQLSMFKNFMIYVNKNKKLFIVDYNNTNLLKELSLKVYFTEFKTTETKLGAYQTNLNNNDILELIIPRADVITAVKETYFFNTSSWELINSNIPD